MKTNIIILFLYIFSSAAVFSQVFEINSNYNAYDTNGPVGECLFPCNEDGKIVFQEIIECETTKERIAEKFKDWANEINHSNSDRFKINNSYFSENVFSYDGQLYIGNTTVEIPWVGKVNKHYSEVKFHCKVDIRDNKFRITMTDFFTERITIRGEAKSNGESNVIHWQRINSLIKERDDARKSKKDEYNQRIEEEEKIYKLEYEAVCNVMDKMKNCLNEEDF